MHELGLAQAIVDLCAERCEGGRVVRVVLEIGELAAAFPEALRFAFEVASEGTPVEGAALDIVSTPGVELRIRQMEVV